MTCFLNVFRRTNGILNKTPFYKYNICNLNKEENSSFKSDFFKVFFIFSFVGGRKPKKYILYLDNIFFFSKIAQITYFYGFILILRQYIYFSLKPLKWPFFQCFFGDLLLLKENHLFYEKNMILHQKSLF